MKKFIAIITAVLMLSLPFMLVSCGTKGKSLADVKAAGELNIATSPDFAPFEFIGDGQKIVGIEIDLMQAICDKLGVKLAINSVDFDSILTGVQAAKYDVGVSGISVTEERKKNTLFTDAYFLAAQQIVVLEGSDIKSKADLTGKKVSVQTGTTAEDFCTENGYSVSAFTANDDAKLALTTGKVDAWVIDNLTAKTMVELYNAENEKKLVILEEPLTSEPYAFAFAFGSEDLVAEINKYIDEFKKDGTIQGLFDKYEADYTAP